jgi:hypothetical protein
VTGTTLMNGDTILAGVFDPHRPMSYLSMVFECREEERKDVLDVNLVRQMSFLGLLALKDRARWKGDIMAAPQAPDTEWRAGKRPFKHEALRFLLYLLLDANVIERRDRFSTNEGSRLSPVEVEEWFVDLCTALAKLYLEPGFDRKKDPVSAGVYSGLVWQAIVDPRERRISRVFLKRM